MVVTHSPVQMRGCQRCGGDVNDITDVYGRYRSCFQCGLHVDIGGTRLEGVRQERDEHRTFSLLRYVGDYEAMKGRVVSYGMLTRGRMNHQYDALVVLCPYCPKGQEMTNYSSSRNLKGSGDIVSLLFKCKRERHIVELLRGEANEIQGWK